MANVINSLKLGSGTYVFTTPYAICETAGITAAKAALITPGSNFSLETGARVAVKFTYANAAGSPTLNVNNTGAKPIYFKNAALTSSNYWSAGQIIDFIYDGTNWVCSAVVTDTKNTAGATDTASMIYLIGATSQGSNPQTYSHDTVYVGTDGCLYSNHSKVATLEDNNTFTGSNTFTKTVKLGDINAYTGNAVSTYGAIEFYNGVFDCGKLVTDSPDGKNLTYKYNDAVVKFPKKSGTLITTSDTMVASAPDKAGSAGLVPAPAAGDQLKFLRGDGTWTNENVNTADATNTSSKIFLIGATSQDIFPKTYSHDTAYVGTDGCLYSNSKKVATVGDNNTFTGTNMFKGGAAQFRTSSEGLNDPKTDVGVYGILCQTGGNIGTYYKDGKITNGTSTLTLPSISGTIALKSDISSIGTFDDSIDIWDTTYSGDKYVSIEAAGSGSICVHNDDDNTLLTLNFPAITDGTYTLATTSDIPSASNFVTVANAQTIYGKKTFNGGVQFGTGTVFNNGGIQIPAANAFKVMGMYDVSLPSKSGTLATTSDIKIKSASLSGTTLSITLS